MTDRVMGSLLAESVEIGIEDENTVIIRLAFADPYHAMELHDFYANNRNMTALRFRGGIIRPVNVEKPRHPIESFPCKIINETPPAAWRMALFIAFAILLGTLR